MWARLAFGDAWVGLHHAGDLPAGETAGGRVRLALDSARPLEGVAAELAARGIPLHRGIRQEEWGRSAIVEDPDGLLIQLNEAAR